MSARTFPVPSLADSDVDSDDGLMHAYCDCRPEIAMCGESKAMTFGPVTREEVPPERMCVVCGELDELPCPICGSEP